MHPCFLDASDYRPMGTPESVVELSAGQEMALGLSVPRPFGPGTDQTLLVHVTRHPLGGHITLAIADALLIAKPKRKVTTKVYSSAMDMQLLSGPRRKDVPDDNGANDHDDED